MADSFGGMPLPSEMYPFKTEISADQRFVTGGDFEDGAVIPNPDGYATSSRSSTPDARARVHGTWYSPP